DGFKDRHKELVNEYYPKLNWRNGSLDV
ncbi:hypothetical protein LCGC14_3013720, partial [marine sediment metagenome]